MGDLQLGDGGGGVMRWRGDGNAAGRALMAVCVVGRCVVY